MSEDLKPKRHHRFIQQPELLKIPRRFVFAEFDELTAEPTKDLGERFVENFDYFYEQGTAPSFIGTAGTGKTHASAAIARILERKGVPCFWVSVVKALNKLMDYKDFRRMEEYFALKRNIITTPYVVMDDFSHLQTFTRTRELFYELVDTRYASKLPTTFTANVDLNGMLEKNIASSLEEKFGAAIIRRVKAMSEGMLVMG